MLAAFCLLVLILGLLFWSGKEADRIARHRDRALVALVLSQMVDRVGHAQESSTVWDDAVLQVRRRPLDMGWIDQNLGIWFQNYAGIDEIYILDPQNRPVYAMRDGRRAKPEAFIAVEGVADRLVAALRKSGKPVGRGQSDVAMLSAGRADFGIVRGRPALVSVKPIVSDSGRIPQKPGTEALHVAVEYLDAEFFGRIGSQFGLADAHYAIAPDTLRGQRSVGMQDHQGHTIGYLHWRPFAPGSQVIAALAPVLLVVLLLTGALVYLLASRLARRTHDLEDSRRHAQHRATHDELTGLGNRSMFEQRLDEALARARRHKTLLALLYIDLDRFKQVNDTLGHPAGDALIRQVARRLLAEVRIYDFVARVGGDEFAIIVGEPENRHAVERICARIVAEVERPFDLAGSQAFIGASIGVALAPLHGLDRTELTRKADIALYRAKTEGRSRYRFFTPDLDVDVQAREETYRDLRQALADCDRQLALHYQPIYTLETGHMVGVEALLRWYHPEHGLMPPADLVRSAEESGLIEVLGDWVLHRAVQDARAWPTLRVAVNVSPLQLRSRKFVDTVRQVLASGAITADRLEVELTETALMAAPDEVGHCLAALRGLGVACALDDFGTGYSSLSHIRDFAVDRVKIDRSFVNAIDTKAGAALVEAIVNLARANGLRLTAEGVEKPEQQAFLRRVGCHEVQGFLLSKPIPADSITQLLQDDVDHDAGPGAAALGL
ncbi:putative bifunctional diguanylate cyclase/phosphodiesterase [Novosphingobium sp. Leaf2]|uniref:putative bifunctional diguanylate cyclase/phosphodiesterase n=1 Tax=Novosphingobium sp. Leaf2 TaxID=1735670 RepID=UPI0006FB7E7D|nr:EAL domain-containing protein [Novosphingobium sp. Leaf2]KQM22274.1 diguanylate cyclase [Novosphingobium sp. Leaf2]